MNSLYIHFPFCKHLCNYCDFYKNKLLTSDQITNFQSKLLNEIQLNDEFLNSHNVGLEKLKTLYIGGGTPSLWGVDGASFIKENIIDKYKVDENFEFTIEVDPDSWTKQEIESWQAIGVTRFSIGAQSFNESFITKMDRQHTKSQIIELLTYLRELEANYSIDLMLGLPESVNLQRDIEKEILEFIEFMPSHFSVYILKTRKNYLHNEQIPDEEYIEMEYIKVCKVLEEQGYIQYEVSNFAKDGRVSKHNLKYWACESVAALGSNATGLISKPKDALRYQWKSASAGFKVEKLSAEEFMIEKVYMGLRSKLGFDFGDFDPEIMEKLFKKWDSLNYMTQKNAQHITLNYRGYLMLDSILDDLFMHRVL